MPKSATVLAFEHVVAVKMKALDRVITDFVKPLEDVGSPEKLIGKAYTQWTIEDLNKLTMVYGTKEPNALSELILRREAEAVAKLRQEVNNA